MGNPSPAQTTRQLIIHGGVSSRRRPNPPPQAPEEASSTWSSPDSASSSCSWQLPGQPRHTTAGRPRRSTAPGPGGGYAAWRRPGPSGWLIRWVVAPGSPARQGRPPRRTGRSPPAIGVVGESGDEAAVGLAELEGGEALPLCRLRYAGSASLWGFAVYLASRDGYQDSVLPSGLPAGTPKRPSTAPAASPSLTLPPGRSTYHQRVPDPARTSVRQYSAVAVGPVQSPGARLAGRDQRVGLVRSRSRRSLRFR
jgi:hypothetical protein